MGRTRVLIVDDDSEVRTPLFRHLQKEGFECIVAAGGAEALHLALQRSPAVVLLDLALGDISGFAVLKALTSDPRTRAIPVVLMTGRSEQELLASAGQCSGAFDLLRKPFAFSKASETLRAAIKFRAARSGSDDPDVVTSGPLRIDLERRQVFVDGAPLRLGPLRREILFALARCRDGLTHGMLRTVVYGSRRVAANTLTQGVSRLREDIVCRCGQDRIGNIPGGYKLL